MSATKNKTGYTATPVACGWAGAVIEVTDYLGRSSDAKNPKDPKKVKCDGRTDQRTDGSTKRGVESRSTRLKREIEKKEIGVEKGPFFPERVSLLG